MNIEETEANLLQHRVAEGQEYTSFNKLCEAVHVEPKVSKGQRKAIERQFRRFFDWAKIPDSYKVVITDTFYDDPKPTENNRQGIHNTALNTPMQELIMLTPVLFETDHTKNGILTRLHFNKARPEKPNRRNTYYIYKGKIQRIFESAIQQLDKQGKADVERYYIARSNGKRLAVEEHAKYVQIYNSVRDEFGGSSPVTMEIYDKESAFWQEVNARSMEELHFSNVAGYFHLTRPDNFSTPDCLSQILSRYPLTEEEERAIMSDPDGVTAVKQLAYDSLWNELIRSVRASHERAIGERSADEWEKDLIAIKQSETVVW